MPSAEIEEPNVESLLKQVHPDGKYQRWMLVILSLLSANCAFIVNSVGFIFYQPEFHCFTDENRSDWRICLEAEACSNQFGFLAFSPRTSLITKFSLYCDKGNVYQLCISFLFCYNAIMSFLCSLCIDHLGRKFCLVSLTLMMVFFGGLALVWPTVWVTTFALANIFVAYDLFYNTSGILINETIGGSLRSSGNSIIFCVFSIAAVVFFVSNAFVMDYRAIFIAVSVIAGLMFPFTLKIFESPVFLLKKRKIEKMYSVLSAMAKWNEATFEPQKLPSQTLEPLVDQPGNVSSSKPKSKSVLSQLKNHKLDFFALAILYANISMSYSLSSMSVQFLSNAGIYVNGALVSAVETVGYLITSKFASKMPRKKTSMLSHTVFICGGSALFVISNLSGLGGIEIAICMILKLALCFNYGVISNFIVESLPAGVRGFSFAIFSLLNRFACTGLGVIVSAALKEKINPLSFVAITSILPLLCLILLKETLGRNLLQ